MEDLLITSRRMTRLDDKDGNLIEQSTRAGHRDDVIVAPQVMEHEQAAWNLDRILDESVTGQNALATKPEDKHLEDYTNRWNYVQVFRDKKKPFPFTFGKKKNEM